MASVRKDHGRKQRSQSMQANRKAWLWILTPLPPVIFLKIIHWDNFLISIRGSLGVWGSRKTGETKCLDGAMARNSSFLSSNWWFHSLCTKCTTITLTLQKPVTLELYQICGIGGRQREEGDSFSQQNFYSQSQLASLSLWQGLVL